MEQIVNFAKLTSAVAAVCAVMAVISPAQTLSTLFKFSGTDGEIPEGLVQATNGELYGTTVTDSVYGGGTLFKITPGGMLTTLYNFCIQSGCPDGSLGGTTETKLVQAANGDLYGAAYQGGLYGNGTIFKITLGGTLTNLYSFCAQIGCPDGSLPNGGLVQAGNGDLYGTADAGGAHGFGTIFEITPGGTLTTLHTFCTQISQRKCLDGAAPAAGLVKATDGDFYGTTDLGGPDGQGNIFKINPSGTLTNLYNFCAGGQPCTDGRDILAGLLLATDGNFYGMANSGGANDNGTIFRITPAGALTTLYSFCAQSGCTDGSLPVALVQANDGNFYGATQDGAYANNGTIFKMTPGGTLTTLYRFCATGLPCLDGSAPETLVQATNGDFYGTTGQGGSYTGDAVGKRYGNGTVFKLSVGLTPFVKLDRHFGNVGALVEILGTDLTRATSVTFNGTAATFSVISASLITATVPSGATTGLVEVNTPGVTLQSNGMFQVVP